MTGGSQTKPPGRRAWTVGLLVVALGLGSATVLALSWDTMRLRQYERGLLNDRGPWFEAYRDLVKEGQLGWEIICKYQFSLTENTRHLRQPIELSALPKGVADRFDDYLRQELDRRLNDEQWAMAYAEESLASYHRLVLWAGVWTRDLRDCIGGAGTATVKLAVACLRVLYGREFGYPWRGPETDQRDAIALWLLFVAKNPPPSLGH